MEYYLTSILVIIFVNFGILKIDQSMSFKIWLMWSSPSILYYKTWASGAGDIFIDKLFPLSKNLFKI